MKLDIVRAWKDETYRQGLSEEQFSMLPANPAGELELADADLTSIHGGALVNIFSDFRFFSVNILSSPIGQTCFQNK